MVPVDILPAWLIDEIERLKTEQDARRPRLTVELPLPEVPAIATEEDDGVVNIPLR